MKTDRVQASNRKEEDERETLATRKASTSFGSSVSINAKLLTFLSVLRIGKWNQKVLKKLNVKPCLKPNGVNVVRQRFHSVWKSCGIRIYCSIFITPSEENKL
jgi:hypothetical protein